MTDQRKGGKDVAVCLSVWMSVVSWIRWPLLNDYFLLSGNSFRRKDPPKTRSLGSRVSASVLITISFPAFLSFFLFFCPVCHMRTNDPLITLNPHSESGRRRQRLVVTVSSECDVSHTHRQSQPESGVGKKKKKRHEDDCVKRKKKWMQT